MSSILPRARSRLQSRARKRLSHDSVSMTRVSANAQSCTCCLCNKLRAKSHEATLLHASPCDSRRPAGLPIAYAADRSDGFGDFGGSAERDIPPPPIAVPPGSLAAKFSERLSRRLLISLLLSSISRTRISGRRSHSRAYAHDDAPDIACPDAAFRDQYGAQSLHFDVLLRPGC